MDINERLEKLEQYVTHHEEDKKNNRIGISSNSQKIESNTGALALLHTINSNSNKYFVIWIITFVALIASIVYIICLKSEYEKIETTTETIQDIDQDTSEGSNYYVGGDYNG